MAEYLERDTATARSAAFQSLTFLHLIIVPDVEHDGGLEETDEK